MNKEFQALLKKALTVQQDKEYDYVNSTNVDENFERQAQIMLWFNDPMDKAFAAMIGVKLARLSALLNGKEPKNESISDSFLDLLNYVGLWASSYERRIKNKK